LRLVILRKSPEATAAPAKRAAQRQQEAATARIRQPDRRRVRDAWHVAARQGYPSEPILVAYCLRWQIELAFKRLKSLLHIDNAGSQRARIAKLALCSPPPRLIL